MNISKLEDLFIEKLSEKYKLTERGLKNVFAKLDTSKDGLLDIDELFVFIKNLLNGIKIEDVKKLVQTYDVNGDGSISFEEFFDMVTNRKIPATSRVKAIPREDTTNLEYGSENGSFASTPLKGGRRRDVVSAWDEDESEYDDASAPSMQGGKGNGEYDRSGLSSARSTTSTSTHVSLSDRQAIESRAALFLRNLRTFLMKEATRMRDTGKVNISQRLGMHSSQLIETIARALLQRHFKPYTLIEGRASAANMPCKFTDFCVARSDFSRVLRSFVIPGTAAPQTIIIDFLFSLCCSETAAPIGDQLASASLFAERVFPTPKPQTTVAPPAEFNAMDTIRNGAKVDRHPLSEEHLAVRRAEVGRGPLKNKDTCLPLAISDLPLKFVSRKSRTSLLASSTIDAVSLNRSSQLPPYTCIRDHVFGLSSVRQSTCSIYSVCSGAPAGKDDYLIYSSAALGIVHDLKTNTQAFFDEHTDDISCISLCRQGNLVATGQVGKSPNLKVWSLKFGAKGGCETALVTSIGEGFFQRMVVEVAFSPDGTFVVAVSGDDHHMMGLWDVLTGLLCASAPTQNGVPPQIRALQWAPSKVSTDWINASAGTGLRDLLCTAGERHLKFWSFSRPIKASGKDVQALGELKSCGAKLNKMEAVTPKAYLCADFIACEGGKSYDVISGGSNGSVYLWRAGCLTATAVVCRGPLTCLQIIGTRVICGGAGGVVKVLDGRTLTSIRVFNVTGVATQDLNSSSGGRLSSGTMPSRSQSRGSSSSRAKSAGYSSTGSRPDTIKSTALTADNLIADASITSLTVCEDRRSAKGVRLSAVASTAAGVTLRIDIEDDEGVIDAILYCHSGAVNGVARWVTRDESNLGIISCGDDKLVCVWDTISMRLCGRYKAKSSVVCCDGSKDGTLMAIGMSSGAISVLALETATAGGCLIYESAFRKDCKDVVSDVKFSPNQGYIAAGSHDDAVYVYSLTNSTPTDRKGDRGEVLRSRRRMSLHPLHRLKGHSSYLTHIDWSRDEALLRSTCGAYELLLWDLSAGKLATGATEADIKWDTHTCVLGFNVMGIWPKYSDGTDVNAVSVSRKKNLIATADDFGLLSLFNYPCVVSGAPCRKFVGHSSHVPNVSFNGHHDEQLVTVGGQDGSVIVWSVRSI